MFDFKKLDIFFAEDSLKKKQRGDNSPASRRTHVVRLIKLGLPAIAAALAGLLVILPGLQERSGELQMNIAKPKDGELEKLHMENTVFYITDKQNRVNNFTAETIDETEPGSKLVKLIHPEGLLPSSDTDWTSVKSPVGYYDQVNRLLWLDEDVKMVYSDGTTALTRTMFYDSIQAKAYSKTPVTADGYFGNLKSEGFEYYKGNRVLIFTGKTKIIIHQENFEEAPQ